MGVLGTLAVALALHPLHPAARCDTLDWQDLTPARGVVDHRPAGRWHDDMLTGNGTLGALVPGHALDERIVVSDSRLFMPWRAPILPPNTAAYLPEIRRLIASGKYQDAADLVVRRATEENPLYAHKRWTDPLAPAFDLRLRQDSAGGTTGYVRSVDYETGVVTVRWRDGRGVYERRVFVSRPDSVLVLSLRSLSGAPVDARVGLVRHPMDSVDDYWQPRKKLEQGIRSTTVRAEDGGWIEYRSMFERTAPASDAVRRVLPAVGYEGVARVVATGGTAEAVGEGIRVRGARRVLVLVDLRVLPKAGVDAISSLHARLAALTPDFDRLLDRHRRIHTRIYDRVRLRLGSGEAPVSVEALDSLRADGTLSPALLERTFDADRYTSLSSCGALPPTLQGIWTGTWGAPWSSDFTLDGNLEVAVAGYLPGNMGECMDGVLSYVESLVPQARINARRLYGARGILMPSRSSTFGVNNHFDRTWPMTFWTAGAGWLAHLFWEEWRYTGDTTFLRSRALPFMEQTALFYDDFLVRGADGRYVFTPSYSPENAPANTGSQAAVNATMDIGVARELLRELIAAADTLGVDRDSVPKWQAMLARMPPYLVNGDGALKEWAWPGLQDDYDHRHASHLYPLFHGLSPEFAADSSLRAAARVAIDRRVDFRRRQGGEMAFGLVQLGMAAISLGYPEPVSFVFDRLLNDFHFRSLNPSHNRRELFNVDISGGFPALLIRSLVDVDGGTLHVMRAFPSTRLPRGELDGARLPRRILVRSLAWRPGSVRLQLVSDVDQSIDLQLPAGVTRVTIDGHDATGRLVHESLLPAVGLPAGERTPIEVRLAR